MTVPHRADRTRRRVRALTVGAGVLGAAGTGGFVLSSAASAGQAASGVDGTSGGLDPASVVVVPGRPIPDTAGSDARRFAPAPLPAGPGRGSSHASSGGS